MSRRHSAYCAAAVAAALLASPAAANSIVDEWSQVKAPPAPAVKPVTIEPRTTALVMLDFVKQNCNAQRRPRCIASIPKVKKLLDEARAKGVTVAHTIVRNSSVADVAAGLEPKAGEPVLTAPADKFLNAELDKFLKGKGIQTVIVVGTAAHGAVLYTASGAAYRGYKVVVPLDGMSAENTYFEQYVAFQLANLPGGGDRVTLTTLDKIAY
jgi:nicotinamidase-related amidase